MTFKFGLAIVGVFTATAFATLAYMAPSSSKDAVPQLNRDNSYSASVCVNRYTGTNLYDCLMAPRGNYGRR